MYERYGNYIGFSFFGQTGSPADIDAASEQNAQLLAQGKLQPTKDMGQGVKFAFDPAQPDIIYVVEHYLGNGPGPNPHYTSIAPAKFKYDGPSPAPWVGTGPDPRAIPATASSSPSSVVLAPDISTNFDASSNMLLYGGVGFAVLMIILLLSKMGSHPQVTYTQAKKRRK